MTHNTINLYPWRRDRLNKLGITYSMILLLCLVIGIITGAATNHALVAYSPHQLANSRSKISCNIADQSEQLTVLIRRHDLLLKQQRRLLQPSRLLRAIPNFFQPNCRLDEITFKPKICIIRGICRQETNLEQLIKPLSQSSHYQLKLSHLQSRQGNILFTLEGKNNQA